jgi:hypothetical protein
LLLLLSQHQILLLVLHMQHVLVLLVLRCNRRRVSRQHAC